jgi:hypothetical protein
MRSVFLALAVLTVLAPAPLAAQSGDDDPTNIVAAQIRAQGYKCDDPQSAKQDLQASRPDEAVWLLQCEDASYRVRLDPDMAATVERVNGKEDTER